MLVFLYASIKHSILRAFICVHVRVFVRKSVSVGVYVFASESTCSVKECGF